MEYCRNIPFSIQLGIFRFVSRNVFSILFQFCYCDRCRPDRLIKRQTNVSIWSGGCAAHGILDFSQDIIYVLCIILSIEIFSILLSQPTLVIRPGGPLLRCTLLWAARSYKGKRRKSIRISSGRQKKKKGQKCQIFRQFSNAHILC